MRRRFQEIADKGSDKDFLTLVRDAHAFLQETKAEEALGIGQPPVPTRFILADGTELVPDQSGKKADSPEPSGLSWTGNGTRTRRCSTWSREGLWWAVAFEAKEAQRPEQQTDSAIQSDFHEGRQKVGVRARPRRRGRCAAVAPESRPPSIAPVRHSGRARNYCVAAGTGTQASAQLAT